MVRALLALSLSAAISLAATPAAHAQDPPPTYQDSTGLTWSVATLELGMLLTVAAAALSGEQDGGVLGVLMFAATVVAAAVTSGVAQAVNAPVEPPMVFHHAFVGAALVGGLMSFSLRIAGERGDVPGIFGVAGLIAGAAGAATYSVLRMERLAHDPELIEEAHVLSWAPVLSAGILTAVLGAVGLDDEAPFAGAVVGLSALALSITLVEVAIAENPPPEERMMMGAPLVGYAGTF